MPEESRRAADRHAPTEPGGPGRIVTEEASGKTTVPANNNQKTVDASKKSQEPLSGYAKLCLVLLVLAGFSLGVSEFIVVGIQQQLADAYGISLSDAGQFMSIFAVAYAVSTPLLALTTGRFKRYHLLVAYSAVFIAGNLLAMVASSFGGMLAGRILIGLVSGSVLAVEVTFIPEFLDARRTPFVISIIYAAFSLAMVLSTSLGKLAAELLTWRVALVGAFILSVAVSVALIVVLPKTGNTDAPSTMREQLPYLLDRRVLSGMMVFTFGAGSVYVFYGYVTPYLQDVLGVEPVATSVVLMFYGAVCMASNLLSGWLAGRFGMKALLATFPLQALFMLGLFLAGGSQTAGIAFIMLIALTMYLMSTPCIAMFMDVGQNDYPQALTLAASIEPMSFNIGIAFGTAVGGAVINGPGMHFAGLVGGTFSLLACAFVALSLRFAKQARTKRTLRE